MTARVAVAFVLLICAGGFGIAATINEIAIVDAVNAKLPVVLGGAGWNPPETLDEFRQQAEAYKQGRAPVRDGDDPKALAALLRGLRTLNEEDLRRIRVPMAALIGFAFERRVCV